MRKNLSFKSNLKILRDRFKRIKYNFLNLLSEFKKYLIKHKRVEVYLSLKEINMFK